MVFAESTADKRKLSITSCISPDDSMPFVNARTRRASNDQRRPVSPSLLMKLRRAYDNLWPTSTVHREDISLGTQFPSLADFL